MTKGTMSKELATILNDERASKRFQQSIDRGEDIIIRVGSTTYRISTKNSPSSAKMVTEPKNNNDQRR